MKLRRIVTVGRCSTPLRYPGWGYSRRPGSTTPILRLRGRWLAREGFSEGQKYSVDALCGTLTLSLADRPPPKNYSAEEAQTLLGGIARRLEELKVLLEEIRDGVPRSPDEDRILEDEIPADLATELRGVVETVLEDDVSPAIQALKEAAGLTPEEIQRQFEERVAEKGATRRLFARIAPRVAEILDDAPPRRPRRRRPKVH